MKHLLYAVSVALAVLAASCGRHSGGRQEVAPVYAWFEAYEAGDEIPESMLPELSAFMKVMGMDSVREDAVMVWAYSPAVAVFSPDVDSVFASLEPLERSLSAILSAAVDEGLELPHRRYAAVVWGRAESIVFCDSVMLIALNHYLGADYPGYSHLPAYRRAAKNPDHLPLDLAESLVAVKYPYSGEEGATALSRMLYEGALNEARLRLAGVSEAEALGYSEAEYEALLEHENELWKAIVAKNLLYSTLPSDAERLVAPAPSTPLLSVQAPGRAGRFIGWRIVNSYLRRNPDAGLQFLLSPEFYNSADALRLSGYVGQGV